jgi:hypothetical protein
MSSKKNGAGSRSTMSVSETLGAPLFLRTKPGSGPDGYVDRIGMRVLVDPFTNKPFVRVYTYKRVGGDVNDFLAIKLLKFI